jgi:NhaA family Na+:H+ antiporter
VLALLGSRVPAALRILLLALAVIDDVGAILVIAIFYSASLEPAGFVVVGVGLATVMAMQAAGVRSPWAYVPPSAVAWAGAYAAGIHPTLVGVVVGLLTPVRAWFPPSLVVERAGASVSALRERSEDDERALLPHLDDLDEARREAVSPVERIQHALHGWVAYGAMPLFALANAGVGLGATSLEGDSARVLLGVSVGLIVGKPVGVLALAWLATALGAAALPRGVEWREIAVVGVVAGIGFTMSIFIAQLAFPTGALLETAKLGVLIGSIGSAILAYVLGRVVLGSALSSDGAESPQEAEQSTRV